jgi:diguanylate cyclase (GGDEF)-like protein
LTRDFKAVKLKNRLLFLFGLITVSLLFFGVVGFINIKAMKKNIDSVYFGSLVPVTELNSILQTYYSTLSSTVHKVVNYEISQEEASSQIDDSIIKIRREWRSYQSHFKRDNELAYIEYSALEIELINKYFLALSIKIAHSEKLNTISMNLLQEKLSEINIVLQKLIKYEVEVARYDRKSFLENYSATIIQLLVVLLIIIVLVLFIFYYVFKGIQREHIKLAIATKKLLRANKRLADASYTDPLTTLYNRRYFNIVYKREFSRAKRERSELTFMMLDIDYFKQYNDTYGHLEGDEALKKVAQVLKKALKRPTDYVFRLGGEEFGILLTNSDIESSENIAQEICDSVREEKIEHKSSKVNEYLTISIGVVCVLVYKDLDENLLLSSADDMLYKAKESGRDRYMIKSDINN